MGKKYFLPWWKPGYETCNENVSLFAVPRETDRLKIWRHAIPRKDRVLQSTDYVCEKYFEPRYVTKTSEAVYKGRVLGAALGMSSLTGTEMGGNPQLDFSLLCIVELGCNLVGCALAWAACPLLALALA
ncbi:hypothetical protein HPB49_006535 [Dermacentor silvarum]|uniref:Uncharacterized protein n=1 Tax=Dermacentor silvarum TaxID=543639 RepID=A0ACB8D3G8_DERSI|nr:hypothetical protein HPB49_006535 [Dermacentor silvarum]